MFYCGLIGNRKRKKGYVFNLSLQLSDGASGVPELKACVASTRRPVTDRSGQYTHHLSNALEKSHGSQGDDATGIPEGKS
jgi:hypothetical protein